MNIKNLKIALVAGFVLTITSFHMSSRDKGTDSGITVANVQAMTEGEVVENPVGALKCNALTQNRCRHTLPDGTILDSVGQPELDFL